MNIAVEEKPNCEVTMQVEVPAERVSNEWKKVAKDFQRAARIPGYRPGKAPQSLIDTRYAKDIREETTNKLLRETLNEAIREKKLKVLTVLKVDDLNLTPGETLRYTATLVTSPEFELPEYKNVAVEVASAPVKDEHVDTALDRLREPHASYDPIEDRGLEMGDFAVVSYSATLDGKPLAEAVPGVPPILNQRENFWIHANEESFIKGFSEALVGAKPDEDREFDLTVAEDYPIEALRGKSLHYKVSVHALNRQMLPEWNDELAARIMPEKTLAELKDAVRQNLERMEREDFERRKRALVMGKLMGAFTCELPAHLVSREMESVLRDIIEENQVRGISEDQIRSHQDEILGVARQNAAERVRSRFLLLRIAEKEKLEVTEQDLALRLTEMSMRYRIPAKKLVKDLKKRDGIEPLREQILASKALELIASQAVVSEPAKTPEQPAAAS